jgi:hypothetical protein
MEKSTIIGIGGLALAGVGAYLYIKSRKAPISSTVTTQPTPPTDDIKALADLGVKIEEPKVTPYVAPSVPVPTVSLENIQKALLALNIDQTRGITELSSPNYIEAKKLSDELKARGVFVRNKGGYAPPSTVTADNEKRLIAYNNKTTDYTKRINALGYKVLANFDIEKM